MDVTDTEHDQDYELPPTSNREGHLIEVKEEKDPLLLTYAEFVAENEVSCISSSETGHSSDRREWQWQIKTVFLKICAPVHLRMYCLPLHQCIKESCVCTEVWFCMLFCVVGQLECLKSRAEHRLKMIIF